MAVIGIQWGKCSYNASAVNACCPGGLSLLIKPAALFRRGSPAERLIAIRVAAKLVNHPLVLCFCSE